MAKKEFKLKTQEQIEKMSTEEKIAYKKSFTFESIPEDATKILKSKEAAEWALKHLPLSKKAKEDDDYESSQHIKAEYIKKFHPELCDLNKGTKKISKVDSMMAELEKFLQN